MLHLNQCLPRQSIEFSKSVILGSFKKCNSQLLLYDFQQSKPERTYYCLVHLHQNLITHTPLAAVSGASELSSQFPPSFLFPFLQETHDIQSKQPPSVSTFVCIKVHAKLSEHEKTYSTNIILSTSTGICIVFGKRK